MSSTRTVIVGAGVGGLAAAVALASRGQEVLVVERAAGPGGKMLPAEVGGHQIDAGPTVFTMRWVFEELLAAAGTSLEAELALTPLSILARHAWGDGSRLDLHADAAASAEAIGDFAGAAAAKGYLAFKVRAERVYRALETPFIRSPRPTPLSLAWRAGPGRLGELMRISPYSTLWDALGRHFADPRLRQLFGRYATYCGASPFAAPATLMLIAHVEQDGVWDVAGGMGALARALARVAERLGVRFLYEKEAESLVLTNNRVDGLILQGGERLGARAVILNTDAGALAAGLFGEPVRRATPALPAADRSLSAMTWAISARASGFPMIRHNVFFSDDYRGEFDTLMAARRVPDQPTIYVCAEDRGDAGLSPGLAPGLAPDGAERLLVLINAPPTGDTRPQSFEEIRQCAETTFARLRQMGLTVDHMGAPCLMSAPADYARRFPSTGGALYGRASHGWRATFQRPGARTRVPGLYLAGGSTHPGPGVPMAAMSGRLAAEQLLADWTSIRR